MDKTKSKLAAFFDNDEEESSFPQKAVDDQKLSQYAQGTVRKSKREKEKEAADAKKREEEESAAKAYAEFLDEFEGEGPRRKGAGFVKADSQAAYAPSVRSHGEGSSRSTRLFDDEDRRPTPPSASAPRPKGKRAMDAFLEEIKKEQADREARYSRNSHGRSVTALAAYDGQTGSKDRGDGETTNVFVANLPPHVTEQSLGYFFAKCGPVGSVKIMWPRGDTVAGPGGDMTASRRSNNAGLSGFVSFMKRKDAEAALRELDGFEWGGSVLRVGWSKAVAIAAKPLYVAERTFDRKSRSRSRSRSRSFDRQVYRSEPRSHDRYHRRSRSRSRSPRRHGHSRRYDSRSRSPSPRRRRHDSPPRGALNEEEGAVTDMFIRSIAAEVKGHGAKYEQNLRERESNNPKFSFLLDKNHRRHAFYRGLIERDDPVAPQFVDEGYNSVYSTDSAEDSERERTRKNNLGKLARRRFESMLRAMSGKRGELARCMAFCLEHAEAACEVSEIIIASLLVEGTAVPRKIARLHLICDILHNSAASVPSAWKFRQEFQSRLGVVFDHFATIYHSFPGRITAETFKKQIMSVVDLWEDWIVFPPDFTAQLRARLEGAPVEEENTEQTDTKQEVQEEAPKMQSKFKTSAFQPAVQAEENVPDDDGEPMDEGSDVDGAPVDDVDGEPMADGSAAGDVDGEPLDDADGEPMDDVDGEPIGDVDGEPIDDVDGEPLEDVDGEPLDEGVSLP